MNRDQHGLIVANHKSKPVKVAYFDWGYTLDSLTAEERREVFELLKKMGIEINILSKGGATLSICAHLKETSSTRADGIRNIDFVNSVITSLEEGSPSINGGQILMSDFEELPIDTQFLKTSLIAEGYIHRFGYISPKFSRLKSALDMNLDSSFEPYRESIFKILKSKVTLFENTNTQMVVVLGYRKTAYISQIHGQEQTLLFDDDRKNLSGGIAVTKIGILGRRTTREDDIQDLARSSAEYFLFSLHDIESLRKLLALIQNQDSKNILSISISIAA